MIGFLYKDFLLLRRQMVYYLLFFALYTAMVIAGVFPSDILSAMLAMIGIMLPMSSFSYDDLARWDKYAASTPAGRAGLVAGKYLFALLTILGAGALVALLQTALSLVGLMKEPLFQRLAGTLASMGAALLLNAIILPIIVKLGAEKSRIIYTGLFIVLFAGSALIGALGSRGILTNLTPPPWLLQALPAALAILAIGGFVLSYFIAQALMARKEL